MSTELVCQYCGERECLREPRYYIDPRPEWVLDCMQRQLVKQSQELWKLRRDVARLLAKENGDG